MSKLQKKKETKKKLPTDYTDEYHEPDEEITAAFIDGFIRVRQGDVERVLKAEQANPLKDEVLARFHENAVFTHGQLENLSHHGDLRSVLECAGIADAITEYFDRKVARIARKRGTKRSLYEFWFDLAGTLESMKQVCIHYGLVAALILSMTFANFGSITKDDWLAFLGLSLQESTCQRLAQSEYGGSCGVDEITPNHLGWQTLYCHEALDMLIKNPTLNLTAAGKDCCIPVIECAKKLNWNMECLYTVGCGGGSAVLLLVVLFASWLYISIHAAKVNSARAEEEKLLVSRLRQEFLLLHFLFFLGLVGAYSGITAVMCIKVTTLNLSYLVWLLILAGGAFALILMIKCIWEIRKIKVAVGNARNVNHTHRIELSNKLARSSQGIASAEHTVARFASGTNLFDPMEA